MSDLFLDILNLSFSASWLILAVIIVRLMFSNHFPKWINCLLWGIVAFRLLVPFSIESSISLVPSNQVITDSVIQNTDTNITDVIVDKPTQYIHSGFEVIDSNVNSVINNTGYVKNNFFQNAFEAAGYIWLCGIIVVLVYAVINYLILRHRVSSSVPVSDKIRKCEKICSPFVLGLFRPRIYLPCGLSSDTEEFVIKHEQSHIKRMDHFIKPFGYALLAIHWFNPLAWIAYILLCRDIEYACDERVLKDLSPNLRKLYANALLECSVRQMRISACPVAFCEAGVKERVKKIMTYKKPAFWIVLTAIIVCGIVSLLFLTGQGTSGDDYLSPIKNKNGLEWYSLEGGYLNGYQDFSDDCPLPSYIIATPQQLNDVVAKQDGTQLAEFASKLSDDFFEQNLLVAVFAYVDGDNEDVIMYSAFTNPEMEHIDITLEYHTHVKPVGEKQYKILLTSVNKEKAKNAKEVLLVCNEVVYGGDVGNSTVPENERNSFFAYVTQTNPLYVDPIEGKGYNSECENMYVNTSKLEGIMPELAVGDRVLIEYDGTTFTSDPPMIMAFEVLPMITFEAYVTETDGLYVDPIEGTGYDWECDKMQVSTWNLAEIPELSVGDKVLITYDGNTFESYPPMMKAYEIVVLKKAE